jgi:hypothetical protein
VFKTNLPHTEPNYTVEIQFDTTPTNSVKQELYIGKFFDAEGFFDKQNFEKQIKALLTRFETQKAK